MQKAYLIIKLVTTYNKVYSKAGLTLPITIARGDQASTIVRISTRHYI